MVNKESHRGQVLMSASYLDELLKRILISYFIDESKHAEL